MAPFENNKILARNLRKLILKSGKDRKEVANDLNFPYSTFTDWVNGKKYPRIDRIEKLAEYFQVPKSYLIEDFEEKQKDNDTIADIIVQLRTNKELLNVTQELVKLDRSKLESLHKLLETFIQKPKNEIQ